MIEADGNRLRHVANGQIRTDSAAPLPKRLAALAEQLEELIAEHRPGAAAAEEVFVNKNPQSTLKLGQARGVVLMCAARSGIDVGEYSPALVKKAVVGTGGAYPTPFLKLRANSEARDASRNGVLRLRLYAGRYDWEFLEATPPQLPNPSPPDHGSGACH